MAKKAARRAKSTSTTAKRRLAPRSAKRPSVKRRPSRPSTRLRTASHPSGRAVKTGASKSPSTRTKASRQPRVGRAPEDTVQTPPSSLNLDRHGSAAHTGRAGLEARLREHGHMSPAITGGDVDADWENAYFSGDEAPGGDNPTPDQEVVDDIGKALGVEYQDNEELKSSDKVAERDRHRWELDPASSEDYKDRK